MEVSVVWLGLVLVIVTLLFLLTQAKGVYDAFQDYEKEEVEEGFLNSTKDDIRLISCPADYKQFINNDGQILCCDGQPNAGKCSGRTVCSLSEGAGGIPTCSTYYTALLDEKGRGKCPPSMPNYFESKDGKVRGCTSGRRKPDGSGPLESRAKFCKLYTSQLDEENKLDSCTNQILLENSKAFSGKGLIPKYNLLSWGQSKPAVVQVSALLNSIPITCYTNSSLERFYDREYNSRSWRDTFNRWGGEGKLNFCAIMEKYKIDKTIRFDDLPFVVDITGKLNLPPPPPPPPPPRPSPPIMKPVAPKVFRETFTTASAGGGGGAPSSLMCPQGSFVNEFYGGAGSLVDRIGVKCSNGSDLGTRGGRGGGNFRVTSNTGFNKLQVRSGRLVDRINFFANNQQKGSAGGNGGGGPITMDCRDGKIMGLRVRTGGLVDNIQVVCGKEQ